MDDFVAEEMYDENPDARSEGEDGEEKHYGPVWTEEEIQEDFMRAEAIKFEEYLGRINVLLGKSVLRGSGVVGWWGGGVVRSSFVRWVWANITYYDLAETLNLDA